MSTQSKITIQQLIEALKDEETPVHPRYLYRLSDLIPDDTAALKSVWPTVAAWRRQALMDDLEKLGEDNYTLSFESAGLLAIDDPEPEVRQAAVRVLLEYESDELLPVFLNHLDQEKAAGVRAVLATALGRFIYLGEIEEIAEKKLRQVEERLLQIANSSEPELVRRRALEALGFSSRKEVPGMIETAYYSGKNDWIVSALFAMGRSGNKTWVRPVIEMLSSDIPDICCEAIRAAGEMSIAKARPRLLKLLYQDDPDVRMAAAWSLSQIGGDGVEEALEALLERAEDEEEIEFIDSAIENLEFTEETELFALMELSDEDKEGDEDEIDDLDALDGDLDEDDLED